MRSWILAAGTFSLFVAAWALAADEPTPPKSEPPPNTPERTYIQTVTNKPPVVQHPRIDPAQPEPDMQALYPQDLKDAGVEGTAVVAVRVLEDGSVDHVKIHQSSGVEELDSAARTGVGQMRFRPGTINGTPNPMWTYLRIGFKLQPEEPPPPPAQK